MRVELGPVESTGALLWIAYARTVLAEVITGRVSAAAAVSLEALERFEHYLDDWERVAASQQVFTWSTEVDHDAALEMATSWFHLAEQLEIEAKVRGYALSPPEGEPFYQAVVTGFLGALLRSSEDDAELAAKLQVLWPGIGPGHAG